MIERVVQSLAYELAADKIRRAVHIGTFVPGDKLPPAPELAKQLGVSRITALEAVRALEAEGYVESRRGASGGTLIVASQESGEVLRGRLRQERKHFRDVMDFRVATEPAAVRLAALSEDGRAAMFSPLDALDFEVMLETSLEGHRRILGALRAADAEGAQKAMVAHIEANREKMRLLLSDEQEE